jgi:hypothetical protein
MELDITEPAVSGVLISFATAAEPDLKPDQPEDQYTDDDYLIGPQRSWTKKVQQDSEYN